MDCLETEGGTQDYIFRVELRRGAALRVVSIYCSAPDETAARRAIIHLIAQGGGQVLRIDLVSTAP
jgi:hypothetical protein